jgi:hypothetical protein
MSLRNAKPKTPLSDPEADRDLEDKAPSGISEVATIPPPFDLEGFARAQMDREDGRRAPSEMPTQPPPISIERATAPADDNDAIRSELCEKFFAGNYPAALRLAEELVAADPDDASARDFVEECCRMLEKDYTTRLHEKSSSVQPVAAPGPEVLAQVPVLQIAPGELTKLALDHHAGFLLSQIDGVSSLETLLDVSAMPRVEALRLVLRLVEEGVIALR